MDLSPIEFGRRYVAFQREDARALWARGPLVRLVWLGFWSWCGWIGYRMGNEPDRAWWLGSQVFLGWVLLCVLTLDLSGKGRQTQKGNL